MQIYILNSLVRHTWGEEVQSASYKSYEQVLEHVKDTGSYANCLCIDGDTGIIINEWNEDDLIMDAVKSAEEAEKYGTYNQQVQKYWESTR